MLKPVLVLATLLGAPASAQHAHGHMAPKETGQSAFAAMAEIVTMLRQNPQTDWDAVDIPALQRHLVDMDLLATRSEAEHSLIEDAVQFHVTGPSQVIEALHRMVPAHVPFLDAETGWTSHVERTETGVILRVRGPQNVIAALGFHGLMTIGAHHRHHHFGIATGTMPHH